MSEVQENDKDKLAKTEAQLLKAEEKSQKLEFAVIQAEKVDDSPEKPLKVAEAKLEYAEAQVAETKIQVTVAELNLVAAKEVVDNAKPVPPEQDSKEVFNVEEAKVSLAEAKVRQAKAEVVLNEAKVRVLKIQLASKEGDERVALEVSLEFARTQVNSSQVFLESQQALLDVAVKTLQKLQRITLLKPTHKELVILGSDGAVVEEMDYPTILQPLTEQLGSDLQDTGKNLVVHGKPLVNQMGKDLTVTGHNLYENGKPLVEQFGRDVSYLAHNFGHNIQPLAIQLGKDLKELGWNLKEHSKPLGKKVGKDLKDLSQTVQEHTLALYYRIQVPQLASGPSFIGPLSPSPVRAWPPFLNIPRPLSGLHSPCIPS